MSSEKKKGGFPHFGLSSYEGRGPFFDASSVPCHRQRTEVDIAFPCNTLLLLLRLSAEQTSVWLWLGVPNTLTVPLGEYLMGVLSRKWIPKALQSQKHTYSPYNHSPPLSRRCHSLQQGKIPMRYNICWLVLEFLKNLRDFRVQENGNTLGECLCFCFEMCAHF